MKKIFTLLFLSFCGAIGIAQNCGPLDSSFGNGGKAIGAKATNSNPAPFSKNIMIQPDNKIVQVVGIYNGTSYQLGVVRYKNEGQLDSSFGLNGRASCAIGVGESWSSAGALQADGKIVVVGTANASVYFTGFGVARFNSNGAIDSSFGSYGRVITNIGQYYDYPVAVAIQPDGKIVVVGSSRDAYYTGAFAIVRYTSSGSIDNSFGKNGMLVTHPGPFIAYIGDLYYGRYADETAASVVVQTDGKIVVAGNSYTTNGCWDYYGGLYCSPAFAMVRYNGNGTTDSTFGINGKVTDSTSLLGVTSMVLQSDGKIVVAGTGYSNAFMTRRYNSDGSIDNGFGNGGVATTQITGSNVYCGTYSVAVGSDGKIVLGGVLNTGNNPQFAILRYTANGSHDNSFHGNGTSYFKIGQAGSDDEAMAVALQGNNIIAGGNSRDNNNSNVVVVRLLDSGRFIIPIVTADGPLSFCSGGNVKLSCHDAGSRQWYSNNVPINGATDTVYVARVSGSYTVLVTDSNGCGISSPVVITVTTPFTPMITANGPVALCIGDNVTLTSNSYGANQWYRDGVAISGATNSSFNVATPGNYTTKVTMNGCESAASNVIAVTLNNNIPTAPVIAAGGDTTLCSGSSVALASSASSGNQWYKNGISIVGATGTALSVTTNGSYTAKVTVSGCTSLSSNVIVVKVNANPPQPPNNWDGTKFFTSPGYQHYQWYQNDTAITGANANSFTPDAIQFGDYKVTITDSNNCSNTSDKKPYRVTAVSNIVIGDATARFYPNPVQTVLNVDLSNIRGNKLTAELYDLPGRLVQKQLLNQRHNQLPVGRLSSGLYQLVICNGTEKFAVKIIITK